MTVARVLSASTDTVIPLLRSFIPLLGDRRDPSEIAELGALRTVAYCKWPEETTLEQQWEALLKRVPDATVFQTPTWQRALLAWPQRLNRLLLVTVWRSEKLIAVLPLQKKRGGRLESAGATLSDRLDPLIDPTEREAAWRSILSFLREKRREESLICLRNLCPDSQCLADLAACAKQEGFELSQTQTGSGAFLKLPSTFDEYLASLKAGDRKELRRKLGKAQSVADAKLVSNQLPAETFESAGQILSFIEAGGGERSMKCRWMFRSLFENAATALAERGWLRAFSLQMQGQPAAGVITFRSPGGWMTWATGYDPSQRAMSPGIVAFAMMIRQTIEEGATHLDLLRGYSDYKARLGAIERPVLEASLKRAG